jgi:molybdopterin molybdotransferase
MDGYAVIASDTEGASEAAPVTLKVIGRAEMGKVTDLSLGRGECAAIPTGGMLPSGADGIVMVEYTEQRGFGEVAIFAPAAPGVHIARRGEDVSPGDVVVSAGSELTPGRVGALAALGVTEVLVYRPLDLFIISTGDELVPVEGVPSGGEVRDINSYSVAALARKHGFRVTGTKLMKDDPAQLRREIASRLEANDVICVSGGSSVGEKDMTYDVLQDVTEGGVFTHGIRVKPGKPTILGLHEKSGTLVAGLPGHPASAAIVFNLLLCRLSRALAGTPDPLPVPAVLSADTAGDRERHKYQTVALSLGEDGGLSATPLTGSSGMITTLSKADGYFMIPCGAGPVPAGSVVFVYPLF